MHLHITYLEIFNFNMLNITSLVKDIIKVYEITGLKFNRRGYTSVGMRVPDVIIMDLKH